MGDRALGERARRDAAPGEHALVRRLREGDEAAFAEIVSRYHSRLVRFAATFVTRTDVAEDVAQDTWLAVLRGIDRYEGRASLQTWLFQICANRARTAAGAEQRVVPREWVDDDEHVWRAGEFASNGAWATPPAQWPTADTDGGHEQLVDAVRRGIAALPQMQQRVVMLRDVEGLSAAEACSVLEISDTNQRVMLHRGRAGVRRHVDRERGSR